ncbi:hypothetical protein BLA29_000602 [Euroglyphus maynei]|uniref:Uncharacterized protein n=1 Tax=Euroglyphus maynei TaxID=6958 RepID=A0A1Y3BHY5_EURMA|nr:hypothetical protein BLA29_000602 [Euroglyphus maynei]
MGKFDYSIQKRLRLASLLFRIIGDHFLSLSSPLTILTKHQTDLDSNILRAYQYQSIAEEREIELFKWIRSQIDGMVWKWPKIVEISGEAEISFHNAYSYLRMEYRTTPECIPLWRCYLQAKRNLYRTIRLIHLDKINKSNVNNQRIHYWYDETKRLFESYNRLASVINMNHLNRMEIFDWIEQIMPKKRYSNDGDENPMMIKIRLDVLQPKVKVDKILAKLFRRDNLWSKKVYDAFGTVVDDGPPNRRLNIIEQLLVWKKPLNSLRIRSQPMTTNRNFSITKSKLKSKSAEEQPTTTDKMEENCSISNTGDDFKLRRRFIRYKPKISWPLENESYTMSSNNSSSGYESISSTTSYDGDDNPHLRTLIDTRRQSLLLRKNNHLIDLSMVNNNNSNTDDDDCHQLLPNRLFPISIIDGEIFDDNSLKNDNNNNNTSSLIRRKPSIPMKPKQKPRII